MPLNNTLVNAWISQELAAFENEASQRSMETTTSTHFSVSKSTTVKQADMVDVEWKSWRWWFPHEYHTHFLCRYKQLRGGVNRLTPFK